MVSDITIRLAQDADLDQIYQIWLEGVENSFEANVVATETLYQRFKTNFDNRSGIFNYWLAEKDGVVLGWQSLIRASYNPYRLDAVAESSTYISKFNREKGVGERLIGHVMCQAESSELEHVVGYVAADNIAARKITARTGWIEIGKVPPSLKNTNSKQKILMMRPV